MCDTIKICTIKFLLPLMLFFILLFSFNGTVLAAGTNATNITTLNSSIVSQNENLTPYNTENNQNNSVSTISDSTQKKSINNTKTASQNLKTENSVNTVSNTVGSVSTLNNMANNANMAAGGEVFTSAQIAQLQHGYKTMWKLIKHCQIMLQ